MLLHNGCQVDVIDKAGMSSLHMAARQAHAETIQLLLQHGASPFLSVKRGIFKGRLAIDFVITAKSKEATSLLLLAMQKPQGWPVSDLRKFVEAALANFRGLPPSGAPKPRKADLSVPVSPSIGPSRTGSSPHIKPASVGVSPQVGSGNISSKVAFATLAQGEVIPEEDAAEEELLKLMDASTSPIFIKDTLGHYLYSHHAFCSDCDVHAERRYCNDEMLRIIGRTIEHVIGRSSEQLEGVETEAKMVISSEGEEKSAQELDAHHVYMLDIIDASGFLHKGSALSSTFPLVTSDGAHAQYDPFCCARCDSSL